MSLDTFQTLAIKVLKQREVIYSEEFSMAFEIIETLGSVSRGG